MNQVVLRSWHDWSNTFDEFLLENVVVDVVKNVMSWHDDVLLCLVLVTLRFHLKLPLWQSTPPPSLSRGTFVDITQRQIVHLWCRIDHIACLKMLKVWSEIQGGARENTGREKIQMKTPVPKKLLQLQQFGFQSVLWIQKWILEYIQRNDKVITRPSLFRLPNGDAGFNMSSLCHLLWFCPL